MPQIIMFLIWDIKLGVPALPFVENKTRLQMWKEVQKTDGSAIYYLSPVIWPLMGFY